jgi:hypothetical protein
VIRLDSDETTPHTRTDRQTHTQRDRESCHSLQRCHISKCTHMPHRAYTHRRAPTHKPTQPQSQRERATSPQRRPHTHGETELAATHPGYSPLILHHHHHQQQRPPPAPGLHHPTTHFHEKEETGRPLSISPQAGGRTSLISILVREEKQRLRAVRGGCWIT